MPVPCIASGRLDAPPAPTPWQLPCKLAARRQPHHGQAGVEARAAAARRLAQAAAGPSPRRAAAASAAAEPTASSSSEAAAASASASTAAALAGLRYVSPDGRWVVRPMDKGNAAEVRRIVALQTEAFHTPQKLAVLDGMARQFFQAEVLSGALAAGSMCARLGLCSTPRVLGTACPQHGQLATARLAQWPLGPAPRGPSLPRLLPLLPRPMQRCRRN